MKDAWRRSGQRCRHGVQACAGARRRLARQQAGRRGRHGSWTSRRRHAAANASAAHQSLRAPAELDPVDPVLVQPRGQRSDLHLLLPGSLGKVTEARSRQRSCRVSSHGHGRRAAPGDAGAPQGRPSGPPLDENCLRAAAPPARPCTAWGTGCSPQVAGGLGGGRVCVPGLPGSCQSWYCTGDPAHPVSIPHPAIAASGGRCAAGGARDAQASSFRRSRLPTAPPAPPAGASLPSAAGRHGVAWRGMGEQLLQCSACQDC